MIKMKKSLKYWTNYQNVGQGHRVSRCCWENGVNGLAQLSVAVKPQFIKKKKKKKAEVQENEIRL